MRFFKTAAIVMFFLLAIYIFPVHASDVNSHESMPDLQVSANLTLAQLVEITVQNYPEGSLLTALRDEADALQRRADSWVAGALNASFFYRDGWVNNISDTGAPEIEGTIAVPLWNWGQRDAGKQLADQARVNSELQKRILKLQVAGLVRLALWDIAIHRNKVRTTNKIYALQKQLVDIVKRRTDAGDLPRSDLMLAESEQLRTETILLHAQEELALSKQHLLALSKSAQIPEDFTEIKSQVTEISADHISLKAGNALIARKKAELNWLKAQGSGQTTIAIGGNSQRITPERSVESITMEVNMPFGGSAHAAPEIAQINLQLAEAVSQRDFLLRQLQKSYAQAQHKLRVDHIELEIASKRKKLAKKHLQMANLSFEAGEIDLLDLIKIQSLAFDAISNAEEQNIILQKDIALFNQVVGLLP